MPQLVKVYEGSDIPEALQTFGRLEVVEYDGEKRARHLHAWELGADGEKKNFRHLPLGRLAAAQQIEVTPVPNGEEVQALTARVESLEAALDDISRRLEAERSEHAAQMAELNEQRQHAAQEMERIKADNVAKDALIAERDAEIERLKDDNARLETAVGSGGGIKSEFDINQTVKVERSGGGIQDGWRVVSGVWLNDRDEPMITVARGGMNKPIRYDHLVDTQEKDPTMPDGVVAGDKVRVLRNGRMEEGWTLIYLLKNEERLAVIKQGTFMEVNQADINDWQDPDFTPPPAQPSAKRSERYWNKTTGFIGSKLPFRRRILMEEEGQYADGYSERERKGGALALAAAVGAAALTAAVMLVGDAIEDHGEHAKPGKTTVVQPRIVTSPSDTKADERLRKALEENTKALKAETAAIERDIRADRYNAKVVDKNTRAELQEMRGKHQEDYDGSATRYGSTKEDGSYRLHVTQGEGYTNIIEDVFPGYSASQYYAAHEAAVRQFGPDYIRGVGHYRMSDGGVGFLHTGNVQLEAGVKTFLAHQFQGS